MRAACSCLASAVLHFSEGKNLHYSFVRDDILFVEQIETDRSFFLSLLLIQICWSQHKQWNKALELASCESSMDRKSFLHTPTQSASLGYHYQSISLSFCLKLKNLFLSSNWAHRERSSPPQLSQSLKAIHFSAKLLGGRVSFYIFFGPPRKKSNCKPRVKKLCPTFSI